MLRRNHIIVALGLLLAFTVGCTNKKSVNPLANVGSKQPDKVLFDKAMDAMRHNRFDVARMTLQVLINTYPDSEFIARAKLAVGDSWYAEGGTAALAQAEQEYHDFETFFPNMPEAAEAQLKIANIQFQQMEKPDRDYTHAKRAEDEYRNLILQYPDSKLVPDAKVKLLQVQEVLADREFGIGRFYFLRQSYPASIARLRSLVEKYPLYSRADEALFILGQNYEGEITRIRAAPTCVAPNKPVGCASEVLKARMIQEPTTKAAAAYSQIITRYPIMDRVEDARKRLEAMHQPVPRPTHEAVVQNKAEDASRHESTTMGRVMSVIKKGPDVARASQLGDPSLVDPMPVNARDVSQDTLKAVMGNSGEKSAGVEILNGKTPGANDAPPSSDNPPSSDTPPTSAAPPATAGSSPFTAPVADPNELKPNAAPDPNELKPDAPADATLPPPTQVNEIPQGASSGTSVGADSSSSSTPATDDEMSTSKKKKKKGLKKVMPF